MSRVRATIPGLVRILSGGYPPGITSASNSSAPTFIDAALDGHRGAILAGDLLAGLEADDHGLMPGVADAVVGQGHAGVLTHRPAIREIVAFLRADEQPRT